MLVRGLRLERTRLETHWTWKMFVEQGEVFIKILRKRFQEAIREVEAISKLLDQQQVPAKGKVLEIYCLTGKHIVGLAERGYTAVGVDISPVMIKQANELARSMEVLDKASFVVGDPRHISRVLKKWQGRFDAVLSMYTYLGSYGENTDEEILKQLRRLVTPQGVVILEVDNRDRTLQYLQKSSIYHVDGLEYHVERRLDIEKSSMDNTLSLYTVKGDDLEFKTSIEVKHRIYSLHELIALFNRTGWAYAKSYGSFNLDPASKDSPSLIVVGQVP
jgi:SAM-dependent methyltransferase